MQRIFVGDVQGCAEELELLIERAERSYSDDFTLYIAGDLVNRGPGNLRALERVRELVEAGRAQYILGNHEIHVISVAYGLRDLSPNDSIGDVLGAPDVSEWVDWLRQRPLVVSGELSEGTPAAQAFAMVHAGSAPTWSLDTLCATARQVEARLFAGREEAREFLALDPSEDPVRDALARMTRCRSATDTNWNSDEPATIDGAWHSAWLAHKHAHGLVYGHWARQGLHLASGLRGLDTGCVHHGRGRDGFLTAWLPDSAPAHGRRAFDTPDERFWQIPAQARYYYPDHDLSSPGEPSEI